MAATRISIALATYNGARFLEHQLTSVLEQERLPDELIVSDDRSTDGTPELLRRFATRAPFPVRVVVNRERLGAAQNFAAAMARCSGDVLLLADQDDVWRPEKIRLAEEHLAAHPDTVAVFHNAEVVDETLKPLGYSLWDASGFDARKRRLVAEGRALEVLLEYNVVAGITLAFRSTLRDRIIPVPEAFMHDAWVALVAAAFGRIDLLDQRLVLYRQHDANQIGGHRVGAWAKATQEWKSGRDSYETWAKRYEAAWERFAPSLTGIARERAQELLMPRIRHFRARSGMPDTRLRRIPAAMHELLSGRYHRYSGGLGSFVKDVVSSS